MALSKSFLLKEHYHEILDPFLPNNSTEPLMEHWTGNVDTQSSNFATNILAKMKEFCKTFLARSLGAPTKCFFKSNNRGRNFRDTLPLKINFIKFSDLLASCYPDHVLGMFKYCQELFKDQPPAALLIF